MTTDTLVLEKDKTNHVLLAFIEEKGLNQSTFGAEVGIKRATVNGWVRQGKQPSLALLVRIATRFGETPQKMNELLGFTVDLRGYRDVSVPARLRIKNLEHKVEVLQGQQEEQLALIRTLLEALPT